MNTNRTQKKECRELHIEGLEEAVKHNSAKLTVVIMMTIFCHL